MKAIAALLLMACAQAPSADTPEGSITIGADERTAILLQFQKYNETILQYRKVIERLQTATGCV